MKIPKAAWWVLAPLSWIWQYLVYVPGHVVWNSCYLGYCALTGGEGSRKRLAMVEPRPRFRPWFIEHLR
jgi:hypothetical protein